MDYFSKASEDCIVATGSHHSADGRFVVTKADAMRLRADMLPPPPIGEAVRLTENLVVLEKYLERSIEGMSITQRLFAHSSYSRKKGVDATMEELKHARQRYAVEFGPCYIPVQDASHIVKPATGAPTTGR